MNVLTLVLIVLIAAAIWAIVELVLTLRKTRDVMDEISHSATEAIDQATPIIAKLDGIVDDLQPALRELPATVVKVNVLADQASDSLESLNGILGDVGSATHGVAGVGESASRIVNTATSAAVGVVSKVASFGGISIPEGRELIGKGSDKDDEASKPKSRSARSSAAEEEKSERKTSYVTYTPVKPGNKK